MSQFAEDVRLLGELNGLIERAQRQAAPPEFAGAVLGAISPVLKAAMPAAQKEAKRQGDILTRAKARIEQLLEEVNKN